jgi:hypothetical protein
VKDLRTELYQRLMEAEDTIAHVLYEKGVTHEVVSAALDAVDERMTDDERREDLYLSALAHYVDALGGRLEIRAVLGEDRILLS